MRSADLTSASGNRDERSDEPDVTVEDLPEHGLTNDVIAGLAPHVGLLVLNWPYIEQALAALIEATSEVAELCGRRVRRPREFTKRLTKLHALFSDVEALAEYRNDFNNAKRALDLLTPIRHAVVHGAMQHFDHEANVVTFSKVNPDADEAFHTLETVRISVANLVRAAELSQTIGVDLQRIVLAITDD